jgi:hypothetical protein
MVLELFTSGAEKLSAPCLLLNVVQSALAKYPFALDVATGIEMAGVVPPELTTGEVAVTAVTPPPPPPPLGTGITFPCPSVVYRTLADHRRLLLSINVRLLEFRTPSTLSVDATSPRVKMSPMPSVVKPICAFHFAPELSMR